MAAQLRSDVAGERSSVWGPSRQSKLVEDFESLDAAYQQHETLVHSLDMLRSIREPHDREEQFTSCLQRAVTAAEHISKFFDSLRDTLPATIRASDRSARTTLKVFQLPELMEQILLISSRQTF